MASESVPDGSVGGGVRRRRRRTAIFFPIMMGAMGQSPTERVVLVNPVTQGMVVLEGDEALVAEMLAGSGGATPASKVSIEALRDAAIEEKGEECAVCLDLMAEAVKVTPCRHGLHGGRVERWFRIRESCPVCRYRMPVVEEGRSHTGGDGKVWVAMIMIRGRC